jgi:hypothetical protein
MHIVRNCPDATGETGGVGFNRIAAVALRICPTICSMHNNYLPAWQFHVPAGTCRQRACLTRSPLKLKVANCYNDNVNETKKIQKKKKIFRSFGIL